MSEIYRSIGMTSGFLKRFHPIPQTWNKMITEKGDPYKMITKRYYKNLLKAKSI